MNFDFLDESSSDPDLYAIIGADETSSIEQIRTEFKQRAKKLHPDKVTGAAIDPKVQEDFERLRYAYDILSNVKTREKYDLWRRSDLAISFKAWIKLDDSSRCSFHWAIKPKKKLMLQDGNKLIDNQDNETNSSFSKDSGQTSAEDKASHSKECNEVKENCEDQTNKRLPRTVLKRTGIGWGSTKLSSKFRKYKI